VRHFSAEEWADFARGAVAAEQVVEMQEHLDRGCEECVRTLRLWSAVRDAAVKEGRHQPPEASIRIVRAMFRVSQFAAAGKPARARLTFDSVRQPLLPGVRSHAAAPRQQLFTKGRFRVDTRIEAGTKPDRVVLLGQVIERTPAGPPVQPQSTRFAPTALLYAAERPLAAANANRFGEFHLEFEAAEDLRLWIVLSDEDPILIRLAGSGSRQN
jgi:hypothetical protein